MISGELIRLILAQNLAGFNYLKKRKGVIKRIYNYLSDKIKGYTLLIPYLKSEFNLRILVNTKDIIGWNLTLFGEYEGTTNKLLRLLVKKNHYVIEAGANLGSETLLMSRLCPHGRVFAFEPAPQSFNYLSFNIRENQLDNVQFFPKALGDKEANINLFLLPDDFPNQGMSSKIKHSRANRSIEVPQTTIDHFLKENRLEQFDFLKMDVQGAELDILKGGVNSIIEHQPIIFLEASDSYSSLLEIFDFLATQDYTPYRIMERRIERIEKVKLAPGNWICFPAKCIEHKSFIEAW